MKLKKNIFKVVVSLNNKLLPSLAHKDPSTLSKMEQALLGYRYWALKHSK